MLCKRFKVTGLVQGVWFRQSTKNTAQSLSLTGWVSNIADGSVELVACGDEVQLDKLTDWLHDGPPAAKVNSVSSENIPLESYSEFRVK